MGELRVEGLVRLNGRGLQVVEAFHRLLPIVVGQVIGVVILDRSNKTQVERMVSRVFRIFLLFMFRTKLFGLRFTKSIFSNYLVETEFCDVVDLPVENLRLLRLLVVLRGLDFGRVVLGVLGLSAAQVVLSHADVVVCSGAFHTRVGIFQVRL